MSSEVTPDLNVVKSRSPSKVLMSKTSTFRLPTEGHLGGFDIRRFIKKNMRVGLAISVGLHAFSIGGYYLAMTLVRPEPPPSTHVIYLDPSNMGPPPNLSREEVTPLLKVAQRGTLPRRVARASGIQRTSGTGAVNSEPERIGLEHGSGNGLLSLEAEYEGRGREVSEGYSHAGSSRFGLGQPVYETVERADVPPGVPIRTGRGIGESDGDDEGGLAKRGRPGRQVGSGVPGPTLASAAGALQIPDMESSRPRIIIPAVPPREESVVASLNPIIDWIEKHQSSVPVTLQRPENLNQMPGDVTTWVTFSDTENQEYTMYLLGRKSDPPQLNIFLRTLHEGTLLQDLGAKGVNEVFKHGVAFGDADNLTVQLSLLPPGSAKAREMMAVFQAWWEHVKNAKG